MQYKVCCMIENGILVLCNLSSWWMAHLQIYFSRDFIQSYTVEVPPHSQATDRQSLPSLHSHTPGSAAHPA